MLETAYNIWIENSLLILYDPMGHTPKQIGLIIYILVCEKHTLYYMWYKYKCVYMDNCVKVIIYSLEEIMYYG